MVLSSRLVWWGISNGGNNPCSNNNNDNEIDNDNDNDDDNNDDDDKWYLQILNHIEGGKEFC